MKVITQCKQLLAMVIAVGFMALAPAVWAAERTIIYTGQGFDVVEDDAILKDQRCGLEGENIANDGGTGQFANWNGPGSPYQTGQPYLVWVLTLNATPSGSVKLYLPDGPVDMIQVGGTWKYASKYYSYDTLVNLPVKAAFDDTGIKATVLKNIQLVVSHGCPPFETEGAWCSPGYWRNADDAAWVLTGHAKTDLFNNTVVPNFYDTPYTSASLPNGPTLIEVLTTPGANTFGGNSDPYGLNAFNATGAFLTDQIPGFHFDPNLIGQDNACPIDNQGNFK